MIQAIRAAKEGGLSRIAAACVACFAAAAAAPGVARASGTITGTVFNDFNANGVLNTTASAGGPAVDVGLAGITVTAYDSAGASAGTTTSASNGSYSLVAAGTGPYRIEFTNLPTDFQSSPKGSNSHTTVQFVPDGDSSGVDLGSSFPADYCQNNPTLAASCFRSGDQSGNSNAAVFSFPYSAGSNSATASDYLLPSPGNEATAAQVGPVWGLAYRRSTNTLYAGAFMKKHAGFGPGGTGAIYQIDRTTPAVSTYADLNAVFGAGTAGSDPHNAGNYARDNDNTTWDAVGKNSLGGMAISDDETKLYVMNLANRTLYELPLGATPAAGNIRTSAVPLNPPSCPTAGDVRPFAVSFYRGKLYVGIVCSAESTQLASDLRAYVYEVDPATLAFGASPVFQTALDYPRGFAGNVGFVLYSANWNPWKSTYTNIGPSGYVIYPQPELSDITFDGGSLILGLRDRLGEQSGYSALDNPSNSVLYSGMTGGDTLRVCGDPSSGWTLESDARCAGNGSGPQGNSQGPGGGEFYFDDAFYIFHQETSSAGLAQVPGFPDVASAVTDPVPAGSPVDQVFSGGVRWWNDSDASASKAYRIYDQFSPGNFGKADGIGDLVALCESAPIEIGNRVWRDDNRDGIQGASEPPIAGVVVDLYKAGSSVASATTDANGNYYFSSAGGSSTASSVYGLSLQANTSYELRVATSQGALQGLSLTGADADSQANGDSRDSDGLAENGYASVPLTTGAVGANKHTYDFGFQADSPTGEKPKISVKKTAYASTVRSGRKVDFKIVVRNKGSTSLTNIEVCDRLPSDLTFVRAAGARFVNGRACWEISELETTKRKTLKLTARVDRGTHHCGRVTNVATTTADAVSKRTRKAKFRVECINTKSRGGGATG